MPRVRVYRHTGLGLQYTGVYRLIFDIITIPIDYDYSYCSIIFVVQYLLRIIRVIYYFVPGICWVWAGWYYIWGDGLSRVELSWAKLGWVGLQLLTCAKEGRNTAVYCCSAAVVMFTFSLLYQYLAPGVYDGPRCFCGQNVLLLDVWERCHGRSRTSITPTLAARDSTLLVYDLVLIMCCCLLC